MNVKSRTIGITLTGALALVGAAACGSSSSGSSSSTAASTSSGPQLEANLTNLKTDPTGEMTQVKLDAGFAKALTSLKVKPGLIGKAKLDGATGTLSFPITGGNVKYYKPGSVSPYVTGIIDHQGSGFTLTAGKTTVGLKNFVVNPGTSLLTGEVLVNGAVAVKSAPLFFLNGSTLQALQTQGKAAILTGTKVYLTSTSAGLLNKEFKITALSASTLVGVATITVNTK